MKLKLCYIYLRKRQLHGLVSLFHIFKILLFYTATVLYSLLDNTNITLQNKTLQVILQTTTPAMCTQYYAKPLAMMGIFAELACVWAVLAIYNYIARCTRSVGL